MFTWNETVAICLISILRDPELVLYFMSILKPMRRDFIEEEARAWHRSLRVSKEERWKKVAELSMGRKFSQMNSSVPVTCTLPFDGGMWRNSRELLKMIRYFRENFIRSQIHSEGNYNFTKEESVSNKIKIVNLLKEDSIRGSIFRSIYSMSMIDEALNDLISFTTPLNPEALDREEWPTTTWGVLTRDIDIAYEDLPYIIINGKIEDIPPIYWNGSRRLTLEQRISLNYPVVNIMN